MWIGERTDSKGGTARLTPSLESCRMRPESPCYSQSTPNLEWLESPVQAGLFLFSVASTKAKTGLRTFDPITTIILGRCYRERKYISLGTAQSSLGRFSLRMAQRLRFPHLSKPTPGIHLANDSGLRKQTLDLAVLHSIPLVAHRKEEDSHARISKLPGSIDGKAETQTDRLSIRWERPATPRTEPRYEISLGKDPRPEKNDAVLKAGKVLRSSRMGRCISIKARSRIAGATTFYEPTLEIRQASSITLTLVSVYSLLCAQLEMLHRTPTEHGNTP